MPGTEEVPDVDHGTTAGSRAPRVALPERPDGCRVGAGRAFHPASQARRPPAHGGCARGAERDPLLLATGCQWRALPKDLPPKSTVHGYLTLWAWDGTLRRLHHALFVQVREQAGKEASPTAAIIDSQSVKGAEKGGRASIRRVTTRARRSRARSGTSRSTRWACY